MVESDTNALENMNMEHDDDFLTEVNVPSIPSPYNTTSHSSIPNEGEGTSKKRKRTNEISKLVKETKNEIHETTNQMKRPSYYRFWKSLDDEVKLEFVKSIDDENK
ncbi:hypothetical protein Ccrd_008287 [Cynara cardunculus var. scolymus]|uniref:Uncharacterized protein n=1 Tax=Cynara cardunculus var. scolymus TaxID=59895 RepID=A0A103XFC6_CYNCS|nr:hypothetical protein Ccrd_008287 [Cynara cardunculus var. scolymus]